MTRLQARKLASRIQREDPRMLVTGMRHFDLQGNSLHGYAVECADTRSGYTVIVHNPGDWDRLQQAARDSQTWHHLMDTMAGLYGHQHA